MSDALVYGMEAAVGLACGITGAILCTRKLWVFGGALIALGVLGVGHAVFALAT